MRSGTTRRSALAPVFCWLVALAALLIGLPTPAAAGARFLEQGDLLILENDHARFAFSKYFRGSVIELLDRTGDVDFVGDLPYPAALFTLTVVDGCLEEEIHNLSGGDFSFAGERLANGARLTLSYSGLSGRPIGVVATVTLADDVPRAEWRIAVDNGTAVRSIRSVSFPMVALRARVGADPEDDAVAFPLLDGVLIRDPENSFPLGGGLVASYPADLSLQMAAVYDSSAGLYVATHDPDGAPKAFSYTRVDLDGVPAAVLQATLRLPELPGANVTSAFPTVLGPFAGDWYDAATLYRDWALQQRWTPSPLHSRTGGAPWWRAAGPVLSSVAYADDGTAHLPAALMPDRAEEYRAALGLPVTLLIFGWEKHGAWTGPDSFPPRDGNDVFRASTTAMRTAGDHAFVYISGTVWRLTRRELPDYDDTADFEAFGRAHVAENCDGEPQFDSFYESIGWRSARMCPGSESWQNTVANNVANAAALGIDAVSVDEFPIGSIYPCYADHHGHPPGFGTWQKQGFRDILVRARQLGSIANPNLILTTEEPQELYLDLIDGYVSRDNLPDGFMYGSLLRAYGDNFTTVPLFAAVFHEFAIAMAEPPQIYDLGGTIEVLRTSQARGLARAYVLGKKPSAAIGPIVEADPVLLDLLRRTAQMTTSQAHDYAIFGRMLRPPSLDVPEISFQWLDVDLVTGEYMLRWQTGPAVVAGAWEAPDGRRATLFANITDQSQEMEVPVDPGDFPPPYLVSLVIDGTHTTPYSGTEIPDTVSVTLPAWGVGMLETDIWHWRRPTKRLMP